MQGIKDTCYCCGEGSEIVKEDIEAKTIVPVCDGCYTKFLSRKDKLIQSFIKKLISVYSDYGIPADTFNASEDIIMTSNKGLREMKQQ